MMPFGLPPLLQQWAESIAPAEADALARQCVVDTDRRTVAAVPVYALSWSLYCHVSGLWQASPTMAGVNLALLLLVVAGRLLIHWQLDRLLQHGTDVANLCVSGGLLLAGLHWGVLTALSLLIMSPSVGWWLTFSVTAGLVTGGALALAINPVLRVSYPAVIYGPVAVGAAFLPPEQGAILLAMIVMFLLYSWRTSRLVGQDYWEAAKARIEAESHARRMEAASITDALTGLMNRQGLQSALQAQWNSAQRNQSSLAVLMIDVDHFKKINDTYGHPFGDECLQAMAACLRKSVRSAADAAARYGGEEFVVLLPGANLPGAVAIARRLLEHVRSIEVLHAGTPVKFTCSVGVAVGRPTSEDGPAQMLKRADDALYRAKHAGRDQVISET